jgi:hypothetical protein
METIVFECIQCQNEFEFTIAEQEYHAQMGFDAPKRCPYCRKHKSKVKNNSHKDSRSRKQFERKKYDYALEQYNG